MDAMTKHRIKRESFIHKNNNLKRTYNNNSIIYLYLYTYSIPPMSSEHTNRSLTIRTTIPTVNKRLRRCIQKLLTLSHIDDFYPQATWIHVYTDGSATDAVQDGGAGSLIYLPNGETLEASSATGKYCTNYDAEVKALEQGAQAVIDLTDANSENVVFLTDSRSVLDSEAKDAWTKFSRSATSIEQSTEWIAPLCIGFIDFKKAFDSIHHETLWTTPEDSRHHQCPLQNL